MMNFVRYGQTFSHQGLLGPSRCAAPHCSTKEPIPTDGDTSTKNLIFRPIPPNEQITKDWTVIAWPTNIQSKTPDGKFGPAKMMAGWGDCWFLAPLAAVANHKDGHKLLAESIKKVDGGYDVTFKGLPHKNVFISDSELNKCVDKRGGDADTRLLQLAADRFFSESGNFQSLFIAARMRGGENQSQAKQCLAYYCQRLGIQDPMTFNPMRSGSFTQLAFFMFTGMHPDVAASGSAIQSDDVISFLNRYVNDESDGGTLAITANGNPLGDSNLSQDLVIAWDVIRTEITSSRRLSPERQAFLNALAQWLEDRNSENTLALVFANTNLKLEHQDPGKFMDMLFTNKDMTEEHFKVLRGGVLEVLGNGSGYIGFPGGHSGTIEEINEAAGTFTYSEPNYPELVHIGELSDLIDKVKSGDVSLVTVDTASERDKQRFEHASTSRGRRLRQLHNQVVRDGTIDHTESGPLADLLEMDEDTFQQVYDGDKNGVIEGDELKSVQLRVDRWADNFELSPIW